MTLIIKVLNDFYCSCSQNQQILLLALCEDLLSAQGWAVICLLTFSCCFADGLHISPPGRKNKTKLKSNTSEKISVIIGWPQLHLVL